MEYEKIETIGNVVLKRIRCARADKPVYSDGPIEKELYEGFKADPDFGILNCNGRRVSWAEKYHLSPVRHNLLRWYQFKADGRALEIGAGCGALTGLLCDNLKEVVALEYSEQRALVTAQRHAGRSNLEVVVGGLQDYEESEKFDYITVIGVLEYAPTFYGGDRPFESFLERASKMLKPHGVLMLAIENKLGLKYLAGAPEDHTARVFDSIYDYPFPTKVRTFSRKQLKDLLASVGFADIDWYYPFPDYKMPYAVLSDDVVPNKADSLWKLLPAPVGGGIRREVLSERRLGKTLADAGLFREFANSFLVIARNGDACDKGKCLRFWGGSESRKPKYRTNVGIYCNGEGKYVVKRAEGKRAEAFIGQIAQRERLARRFFDGKAEVVLGRHETASLFYSFVDSPSLEEAIAFAIEGGGSDFGAALLNEYKEFLYGLPTETSIPEEFMREFGTGSGQASRQTRNLSVAVLDCIPANIKTGDRPWRIIDNEWTFDYPVPVDYVLFRGILTLIVNLQAQIQQRASKSDPVALFWGHGRKKQYIPVSWLGFLNEMDLSVGEMIAWESRFQSRVHCRKRHLRLRLKAKPVELHEVPIEETMLVSEGLVHRVLSGIRKAAKSGMRMMTSGR